MTMNSYSAALAGVGLLGAMATAGCNWGAGGEYATKREFDALRTQFVASHDTMVALWEATDSMNKVLREVERDTTSPPPKCPPICLEVIPRPPARIER
jgi:hypothetical protein